MSDLKPMPEDEWMECRKMAPLWVVHRERDLNRFALVDAVSACDAAEQVILDALSMLSKRDAHRLMDTSSYQAFKHHRAGGKT